MQKYTLGFLFNEKMSEVVLIRKNRPQWQAGLLNGVGGHVEEGEAPLDCQRREFWEETGVTVDSWKHFATLFCNDFESEAFEMFCYYAQGDVSQVTTTTDEELVIAPVTQTLAGGMVTLPNVPWLIAMAESHMQPSHPLDHLRIEYVRPS